MRLLYGQCSPSMVPNIPVVRNQLVSDKWQWRQCKVYKRVEVPLNKVVFREFWGPWLLLLLIDTSIILEDELEVECRTSLSKMDGYFYATILSVLRDNGMCYIPFKWMYLCVCWSTWCSNLNYESVDMDNRSWSHISQLLTRLILKRVFWFFKLSWVWARNSYCEDEQFTQVDWELEAWACQSAKGNLNLTGKREHSQALGAAKALPNRYCTILRQLANLERAVAARF